MTEEMVKQLVILIKEGGVAAVWVTLILQIKGVLLVIAIGVIGTFTTHFLKFWVKTHYKLLRELKTPELPIEDSIKSGLHG